MKLLIVLCLLAICVSSAKHKSVRLTDVNVLTLHKGRMSEGRRSDPVPQLTCLSGCDSFIPETVQCYNRGSDGVDVQWECKADLPGSTRFGEITVACEGYDHPDDPFILQGSCGLEYTLLSDDRSSYNSYSSHNSYSQPSYSRYGSGYGNGSSIFVLGLMCFVVYYIYTNCWSARPGAPGYGGGAGGSRWGGDFPGGGGGPYGGGSYGNNDGSYKNSQSSSYGANGGIPNNRPGFWSGLLGGGALGYMLGNRNNGYGYGGYQQPWNGYGGGFTNRGFGGGWGGGGMRMGGGGGGGGMRSSSGFGGTRRR